MDWPYPEKNINAKLLEERIFYALPDSIQLGIACQSCNTLNKIAGQYCRKCRNDLNSFEHLKDISLQTVANFSKPTTLSLKQLSKYEFELNEVKSVSCIHIHLHYIMVGCNNGKIFIHSMLCPDTRPTILNLGVNENVLSLFSKSGCDIIATCENSLHEIHAVNGDLLEPLTYSKLNPIDPQEVFRNSPVKILNSLYYLIVRKSNRLPREPYILEVSIDKEDTVFKTERHELNGLAEYTHSPLCAVGNDVLVFTSNPIASEENNQLNKHLVNYYSLSKKKLNSKKTSYAFISNFAPIYSKESNAINYYGENALLSSSSSIIGSINKLDSMDVVSYQIQLHSETGYLLITHEEGMSIVRPDLTTIWDSKKISHGNDASSVQAMSFGETIIFSQLFRRQDITNWVYITGRPWEEGSLTSVIKFDGLPLQPSVMAFGHWVFIMRNNAGKIKVHVIKPEFMQG